MIATAGLGTLILARDGCVMLQTELPGRSRYSKCLGKLQCTAMNRILSWIYFMKKVLSRPIDLAPSQSTRSTLARPGHAKCRGRSYIMGTHSVNSGVKQANVRSTEGFISLSMPSFLFLMSKYVTLFFFTFF